MGVRTLIQGWPVYRQLKGTDPLGRGDGFASSQLTDTPNRGRFSAGYAA